jgi:electron transfer flavoprotein beta subunit
MDIIACVKRVPLTQEVDLEIDESKKTVRKDMLAYVINEWDNYAIEEAILLKEKLGGTVTAITIGSEDDEEVLRRSLAMGADRAVRIDPRP